MRISMHLNIKRSAIVERKRLEEETQGAVFAGKGEKDEKAVRFIRRASRQFCG